MEKVGPGNTKGGITVPLTSCLTGSKSAVWQLTIFVFMCKTDSSKPVKQEVNGTVILPPLVFPGWTQPWQMRKCKSVRKRWKKWECERKSERAFDKVSEEMGKGRFVLEKSYFLDKVNFFLKKWVLEKYEQLLKKSEKKVRMWKKKWESVRKWEKQWESAI